MNKPFPRVSFMIAAVTSVYLSGCASTSIDKEDQEIADAGMVETSEEKGEVIPNAEVVLGKVYRPDVFDITRRLDENNYNINYGINPANIETNHLKFRKDIYDQVIMEYGKRNNITAPPADVNSYKQYLIKNTRGTGMDLVSMRNMIEVISTTTVFNWHVHKAIYEQYGGAVSVTEGWLPVEGYLEIVQKYDVQNIIDFPNKISKDNFLNYYKIILGSAKADHESISRYFNKPWWYGEGE